MERVNCVKCIMMTSILYKMLQASNTAHNHNQTCGKGKTYPYMSTTDVSDEVGGNPRHLVIHIVSKQNAVQDVHKRSDLPHSLSSLDLRTKPDTRNWSRNGKECQNRSNMFKHVQTCSNMFKHVYFTGKETRFQKKSLKNKQECKTI